MSRFIETKAAENFYIEQDLENYEKGKSSTSETSNFELPSTLSNAPMGALPLHFSESIKRPFLISILPISSRHSKVVKV